MGDLDHGVAAERRNELVDDLTGRSRRPAPMVAWTNWNPDPLIHAFGAEMRGGRVLALCRVSVRQAVGFFDPEDPKACPDCADFVRHGQTWDDVKDRKVPIDTNAIVCRRTSG